MGRLSGGVVVLVKEHLAKYVVEIKNSHDNLISIKLSKVLSKTDKDLLITFAYIPPYKSTYYKTTDLECAIDNLQNFLIECVEREPENDLLIMGDLNARISDWEPDYDEDENNKTYNRQSKDQCTNSFAKNLIELCSLLDLIPLNGIKEGDEHGEFTFNSEQGRSVIDYALASKDLFANSTSCFHVNTGRVESDHSSIEFSILLKSKLPKHVPKNYWYKKLTWDPVKSETFLMNLESWESKTKMDQAIKQIDIDINAAVTSFNNTLKSAAKCMEKNINLHSCRNRGSVWFDRECARKKQEAASAKRKQAKSNDPRIIDNFHKLKKEYKKDKREKKINHRQKTKQELLQERKNGKKFWAIIKKARNTKSIQPNISIEDWTNHFRQLLSGEKNENSEENQFRDSNGTEDKEMLINELDKDISENEIRYAINDIKLGKSAGYDSICGEFLKYSEKLILPFFLNLFNKVFNLGAYPKTWSFSIICPIYKNGDRSKTDNYRGISLLSVVSKVFSNILYKRLYNWIEKNGKISNEQAGFRRNFSTIDHIFTLVSLIRHRMQTNKGKVYVAFIDYHKAFDNVNKENIWKKLKEIGVSTKLLNMLKAMYKSVRASVRWNGIISEPFDCPKGLKQGCILSPLLFSLLIDEVAAYIYSKGMHGIQILSNAKEIFCLLFADDVALLATSPHGLQNQLNNLATKSKELGLTVNLKKTKIMVFRKGGFLGKNERWHYEGNKLEVVNKFKYLGHTITTKLSTEEACEENSRKAKGKIMDIFKTMWTLGNLDTNIFFQLYDCQIKPMLLYGSQVWGGFCSETIESAHLFALKRLLSVSNKTPNTFIYGETGRYPMNIDAEISTIKYWYKISKLPITRLPKQVLTLLYKTLDQMDKLNKRNWLTNVRDCLIRNGYSETWETGKIENETIFFRNIKERMMTSFLQNWKTKLYSSERFATYRIFKNDFGLELYIDDITIKKFRNSLVRFRLGINELRVNKRFQHNNLVDKSCPLCEYELEDEIHFLFVCEGYRHFRSKYLSGCYEFENLIFLQDPNINVSRKIAMYIYFML